MLESFGLCRFGIDTFGLGLAAQPSGAAGVDYGYDYRVPGDQLRIEREDEEILAVIMAFMQTRNR